MRVGCGRMGGDYIGHDLLVMLPGTMYPLTCSSKYTWSLHLKDPRVGSRPGRSLDSVLTPHFICYIRSKHGKGKDFTPELFAFCSTRERKATAAHRQSALAASPSQELQTMMEASESAVAQRASWNVWQISFWHWTGLAACFPVCLSRHARAHTRTDSSEENKTKKLSSTTKPITGLHGAGSE